MFRRIIGISVLTLSIAACSSVPSPDDQRTAMEAQALCGGGIHPGCGACYFDAASPTKGSRTCWYCDGTTHQQTCSPPPVAVIDATWSGHVWVWSPQGPTNGEFSLPIVFYQSVGGNWTMDILQSEIALGVALDVSGYGPVHGNDATLTVPVSAAGTNTTLTLSTNASLTPPGQSTVHGISYSAPNALFSMVGSDGRGFEAFLQGAITTWP